MRYTLTLIAALTACGVSHADVTKLFSERCSECHGKHLEKPKGKMYVSPDATEKEKILQSVLLNQMPPNKPLSQDEKLEIQRWARPEATAPPQISPAVRTVLLAGKLHILVVHFPIALIFLLLILEFLNWMGGELDKSIKLVLLLTSITALAAAGLGWLHALPRSSPELELHRWCGLAAALACGGLEWYTHHYGRTLLYKISLFVTAGLVVAAAHTGGSLVHGSNFLSW